MPFTTGTVLSSVYYQPKESFTGTYNELPRVSAKERVSTFAFISIAGSQAVAPCKGGILTRANDLIGVASAFALLAVAV